MSDEFEDDVDSGWPAVAGHADGRKDQPLAPTPVTCLHAAADQRQRAGRTACRIRPCGPLSLFAIASGAFASLLTRAMPDGIAMVLEDAARYRREQVFEPARFAVVRKAVPASAHLAHEGLAVAQGEEAPGRVVVGFLDSQTMVGLVGKPGVKKVADDAESRLRRACAALGGGGTLAV